MSIVAALVGALLYGLALPPYDVSAAGWFAIVPLLLVVRGRDPWSAFRVGVLSGFLSAWVVTWWLAQAVARYFAAGMFVGVLAMSAAYALAVGSAFGLFAAGTAVLVQRARPLVASLTVPALWVACELLRGRLIGQPWGLLGYTQYTNTGLIQVAALTGVYGVSFVAAMANVAIAEAIARVRTGKPRRAVAKALALPACIVGAVWLGGALHAQRGPAGGFAAQRVAVIQTNVAPAFEWTRAYAEAEVLAHVRATDALPPASRPALIVWPENAVPRYLEGEPGLAAELAALAMRHRADLLFGAPRHEDGHTYNSLRLITAAGRNGGHYDKRHLVLFAEAGPLAGPVSRVPSESPREFSAGAAAPGILRSFVPLGVSICHEILYPELVQHDVRAGAALLVNVSNDGWLDAGYGMASRQHFAMAVFRAVEARRYLVRAATTGVSGVVDPYGRIVQTLPPGAAGVIQTSVAGRISRTPYTRFGDLFAVLCAAGAGVVLWRFRPLLVWRRRLVSAHSTP